MHPPLRHDPGKRGIDLDTRRLDLDDDTLTENTRAAYPITHLPEHRPLRGGGPPQHIFMLTGDAFGVLPPIARLTPEQATYHFLSGYTAKVAGTERGMAGTAGHLQHLLRRALHGLAAQVYAQLFREKITRHRACWLVNTGWTGGPFGVGQRMEIAYTRALLRAAMSGKLDDIPTYQDPFFGLTVPAACPGVPEKILNPRNTWEDQQAYDAKARELAGRFRENFGKYASQVGPEVLGAEPR